MAIKESALGWPALDSGGRALPAAISYERGVWGKVHGAPSDFRWIAATRGLTAPQARLERELPLGAEDAPRNGTLWRVAGETCYAISFYPSNARDAAGRSGFIEKQVLEWKRPHDVPAALGALLLLPAAARLEAFEQSAQVSDVRWSDDDPFDLEPCAAMPVSVAAIEAAVAQALQALSEATSEEALAALYARLLAGNRGVPLDGLAAPLPPAAVAALLLPLPRGLADELSIAGWLPSAWLSEATADEVRRAWHLILGGTTTMPQADSVAPTSEQLAAGRDMADQIFARRPPARAEVLVGRSANTVDDAIKPVQLALWGPSAAGKTALLAKLFLDANDSQWDVFPTQGSLDFIHLMRTRMRTGNQFPSATPPGQIEAIEYLFRHRSSGTVASLQLEDRAGLFSEQLHEEDAGRTTLKERLRSASGIVLLFDPLSDQAQLESRVSQTLELLNVASGRPADRDDRPIAVCVSKADLLIERPSDFRRALEEPDRFVRERVAPVLVTALDRYCENYRLFPISAAGVRLRQGIIEPTVFVDEAFEPRICPGGKPFNLMAPFSWLLNELTGVSS